MVRHWVLVPAFGGSNPSIPAKKISRASARDIFFVLRMGSEPPSLLSSKSRRVRRSEVRRN